MRRQVVRNAIRLTLAGMLSVGLVGCGLAGETTGDDISASSEAGVDDGASDGTEGTDTPEDQGGLWVLTAVHSSWAQDTDGDGAADTPLTSDTTFDIDEHGNVLRMSSESPVGEEGIDDGDMPSSSKKDEIEYEHDANGFVTGIVIRDKDADIKTTLTYDFGDDGWPTAVSYDDDGGEVTGDGRAEFVYDSEGILVGLGNGNASVKFDADGRLLEVCQDVVTSTYEYDDQGHLIRERSVSDSDDRVTDVVCEYDENGNMISSKHIHPEGLIDRITYEYTYVASPSDGARFYAKGSHSVLEFL